MKRNNAEDEDDRKCHNHDGVDLEPRGFIRIQLYHQPLAAGPPCSKLSLFPTMCAVRSPFTARHIQIAHLPLDQPSLAAPTHLEHLATVITYSTWC